MSFDDFYLILQGLNLKTNKNIFFATGHYSQLKNKNKTIL
jgi:hypothetical protein